jgi:hypothetical protein
MSAVYSVPLFLGLMSDTFTKRMVLGDELSLCASKIQWRHTELTFGLVSERNQEIFSLSATFGNEPKVSVI